MLYLFCQVLVTPGGRLDRSPKTPMIKVNTLFQGKPPARFLFSNPLYQLMGLTSGTDPYADPGQTF